ncbi:MAG TPA: hypothetical protein VGS13_06910 [Stellaceae bacterium]|nr:hypothetical protein [Stellaceae bacterium]
MAVVAGTLTNVITLDTSGNYASPLTVAAAGYIATPTGDTNNDITTQSGSVSNADAVTDPSGIVLNDDGPLATSAKEALLARNYHTHAITNASGTVDNFGTTGANRYGIAIAIGLGSGASTSGSPNFAGPVTGNGEVADPGAALGVGDAGPFAITNLSRLTGLANGDMARSTLPSSAFNPDLMVFGWYRWGGGSTIVQPPGPVFSGSYAGTVVVSNPATEASTIFTAGATVSASYGPGVLGVGAVPWMVTNLGTVSATGWNAAGVELTDGGTVVNRGEIIGSRYGVVIGGAAYHVINFGPLPGGGVAVPLAGGGTVGGTVIGLPIRWNYYGPAPANSPGTVINYGMIEANVYGIGVSIDGGALTNGSASDPTALIAGGSGFSSNGVAAVTNYGTIAGIGAYGFGVDLAGGGSVVNHAGGLITGGAIGVALCGDASTAALTNYGIVVGGVGISDTGTYVATDTIINAGIVASSSGSSGTAISLSGNDLLVLEAGSAVIGGIAGFREADTIDLAGQAATGLVYANGTLTVFDNASVVTSFALSGPFDPNTLVLNSDGHGGTDITIAQPAGPTFSGSYTHTVVIANAATETATDFTASASVWAGYGPGILGIGGVAWAVTNSGHVSATGANAAGVELTNGGAVVNAGQIAGSAYGVLISGAAGSLTNYGAITTVPASGIGVRLSDGGALSNGAGDATAALISGYYDAVDIAGAPGMVTNAGTLIATGQFGGAGVRLEAGGAVVNSGSAALISGSSFGVEVSGGLGAVTNSGAIAGLYTGLYLQDGGGVTNEASGVITGSNAGVLVSGGAGGINNSGSISASTGVGVELSLGGTLVNSGVVAGTDNCTATYQQTSPGSAYYLSYMTGRSGVGIELDTAGSVVNFGTVSGIGETTIQSQSYYGSIISVSSAPSGIGVYLTAGGSVTNAAGGLIEGNGVGIDIAGGPGTVINAGTISGGGGTAVEFAGGYNLVVVDPGAVFQGIVNGGTGNDTLELAGGAGIGTLSGLGTQYLGFSVVTVDAGARWVLSGSNTIDAGVTLDDRGSVTVEGATTGGGNAEISGDGTLEFAAGSDAAVTFDAGASGMLKLDRSAGFAGTIAGFGAGDLLDLGDIAFSTNDTLGFTENAAGTGGTLTLGDGTHTASLALLGQYAAAGFAIGADAEGAMLITYTPQSGSGAEQAMLTIPYH